MAQNTLEILIKVTKGQAEAALKSLDKTVDKFGTSSTKGFAAIKAKFSELDKTLSSPAGFRNLIGVASSVVGALAGVGVAINKLASDYQDYAFQVKDFGRIIGATPEEASKLIQVADDARLSIDSMTMAMRYAISQGIRPTVANLAKMADEYNAIQDPINRSAYVIDKFGSRAGLEMAKLLELGSAAIKEMGDSVEGTARLMTQEGIQAAQEYYNAMDNLGDAIEDLKLSLGSQLTPVVADTANLMSDMAGSISQSALPSIWDLIDAASSGEVTFGELTDALGKYFSGAEKSTVITELLAEKELLLARSLESVQIGTTATIPLMDELGDQTDETGGSVEKAASAMSKFAGAARQVPRNISIGFDFKLPNITQEIDTLLKGKEWEDAGGRAIEQFYQGIKGNLQGLSTEDLAAVGKKLGALELAAKVKIGEMSTSEAAQELQRAFGGQFGEATAEIKAALAIDTEASDTAIQDYLRDALSTPIEFSVTPKPSETSVTELQQMLKQKAYDVDVNPIIGDASRQQLIGQIQSAVTGEIPPEVMVKLKELPVGALQALVNKITPPEMTVTVNPEPIDQSVFDALFEGLEVPVATVPPVLDETKWKAIKEKIAEPLKKTVIPSVNMVRLYEIRELLSQPVYVPVIPVQGGKPPKPPVGGGVDEETKGAVGLSMIIPPGYPNDSYLLRATSGERVTISTPSQQQRMGSNQPVMITNNFKVAVTTPLDVRELARQVAREQQRAGIR